MGINIHVLSYNTGWIEGKECDECKEICSHTVEFKAEDIYLNMCSPCYKGLFKQVESE